MCLGRWRHHQPDHDADDPKEYGRQGRQGRDGELRRGGKHNY